MKPLRRLFPALATLLMLASPLSSLAASLTGTVTNKTTNKPASGNDVVLLQLQGGMTEAARTKTDGKGRFSFNLPDAGPHLIRVEHQKGSYFKQTPPGTQSVEIDVFDVAAKVEGVTTEADVARMETDSTGLKVTENYFVKNQSSPPRSQFSDRAYEIYLPLDATIDGSAAMAPNGMPVASSPVPLGDKGHYAFVFLIRPGETRFQVSYHLPYKGSYKFTPRLAIPAENVAIMLPKSMKFSAGNSSTFQPTTDDLTGQTFLAKNAAPGQSLEFTVSGTGALPREAQGADAQQGGADGSGGAMGAGGGAGADTRPGGGLGAPVGGEDPINKYRWWILGGLSVVLAVAAGFLLRKPSGTPQVAAVIQGPITPVAAPRPVAAAGAPAYPSAAHTSVAPASTTPRNTMLAALKDELFSLETERLEGKITDSEYAELKSAFQTVLRRTLARQSG